VSQQWRALWVAVGYLSQAAALAVGAVIATWTFSALLLVAIVRDPRTFNNDVVSDVTLGIDLILIMVAAINTRTSNRQAATIERQVADGAEQAKAVRTALVAIERRLHRIETMEGLPAERHPNRRPH